MIARRREAPGAIGVNAEVHPSETRTEAAAIPLWRAMMPLRGLATLAVVLNHASQSASGLYLLDGATVLPTLPSVGVIGLGLVRALTPACLVAFVFASGFMAYRTYRDARGVVPPAMQLLRKYLFWSVALFAFNSALARHFDLVDLLRGLVVGDVMPAYWFPLMLVPLQLASPLFVGFVRRSPKAALAVALLLQLATCVKLYTLDMGAPEASSWEKVFVRPVGFVPEFLIGMLAAQAATPLSSALARQRRAVLVLLVFSGIGCVVESSFIERSFGFTVSHLSTAFATERLSLILFGLLASLVFVTSRLPARATRMLADVGDASLGVMFLMDFYIRVATWFVYRVPHVLHAQGPLTDSGVPLELAHEGPYMLPLFFAAGLLGPMATVRLSRRVLGPRARFFF